MQSTSQEIEAQAALKNLARRKNSEAILSGPASPGAIAIGVIPGGIAGVTSYILQDATLPSHFSVLLFVVTYAVSVIGLYQWNSHRRLEAMIELVKLQKDAHER